MGCEDQKRDRAAEISRETEQCEPVKFSVKVNNNKRSVKDDSLRSVDPVTRSRGRFKGRQEPLIHFRYISSLQWCTRCARSRSLQRPFHNFNTQTLQRLTHKNYSVSRTKATFHTQELQCFIHKGNSVSYSRTKAAFHTQRATAFHTQRKQRFILKSYSVSYTKETAFYTQKLQRLTHKCYAFP